MNLDNRDMTRHLHELVRDHPDFEVLCEPTSDPYYFRCVPNKLAEPQEQSETQLNRLNERIVESIQRGGLNSVTTTCVRGRVAIQIAKTSNGTIDATFEAIARWGHLLNQERSVTNQTIQNMEAEQCSSELDSSLTEVSAT